MRGNVWEGVGLGRLQGPGPRSGIARGGLVVNCMQVIHIPRALSSSVQRLIRSWTSSGSTVVRVHASSHRGFLGAWSARPRFAFFLDFDLPSLPFRREKILGMVKWAGRWFAQVVR